MGRPRQYEDPEQIKLRAEASVKAQLRAKARALGMTLTQLLISGALALPGAVAFPQEPTETHAELRRSTTETELPVLPRRVDEGVCLPAPCPLPQDTQEGPTSLDVRQYPILGDQQTDSSAAATKQLTPPPIQHRDRLSAEQRQRIHAARLAIFSGFPPSELDEADRGPKESPNADVDAWPDYYEACLRRLRREYGAEVTPPRPAEPNIEKPAPIAAEIHETDPVILELLRRDRELAEIDRSSRSIKIANERQEISQQIHRRRMAEASAKLRAFDPDPEKPPSPKEIRAVAAELTPKNRNDHPWRKVLPPKRPK